MYPAHIDLADNLKLGASISDLKEKKRDAKLDTLRWSLTTTINLTMSLAPSARSGKGASRAVRNRLIHWPAAVVKVEGINSAAQVKLEPCAE